MLKHVIRTVIRAYRQPLVKTYVYIRFKIINPSIIEAMLNYFRPDKSTLLLGCGFGLFDCVLGLRFPDKHIHGIDINAGRLRMAGAAARRLRLRNNTFSLTDLSKPEASIGKFDEILLLDILHHIPQDQHESLLAKCHESLSDEGRLVIKDIHRESPFKLFFTWLLDMAMTKCEPVWYRDKRDVVAMLEALGFRVLCLYLDDILPYPHILYVCFKDGDETP